MADIAYLKIGQFKLRSVKYEIPYSWLVIYDELSSNGLCSTDVGSALKILLARGLTLDDLESNISTYTGWPRKLWKRYRSFVLTEDSGGLEKRLKEDGFNIDGDEDYPNVIDLLEQLEVDEGLWELIGLYRMFLALNESNASKKVTLDVRQFRQFYDNDFVQVYADTKQNFIDKVKMYNYLFDYTVNTTGMCQGISCAG